MAMSAEDQMTNLMNLLQIPVENQNFKVLRKQIQNLMEEKNSLKEEKTIWMEEKANWMKEKDTLKEEKTIWMEEKDNLIKEKDILKAYYLSKKDNTLEKILKNPGLQHLAENIFGNLNFKYLKVCKEINQSSKEILANPIFWKRKLEGSLSQKEKDFIKAIQSEKYLKKYKDIISILQWMLEKSPDQNGENSIHREVYNGPTDFIKILATLTISIDYDFRDILDMLKIMESF